MYKIKDNFVITDQSDDIDREFVLKSLNQTYWAEKRTKEINDVAIENSICLSLFDGEKQIGFTRIVSQELGNRLLLPVRPPGSWPDGYSPAP